LTSVQGTVCNLKKIFQNIGSQIVLRAPSKFSSTAATASLKQSIESGSRSSSAPRTTPHSILQSSRIQPHTHVTMYPQYSTVVYVLVLERSIVIEKRRLTVNSAASRCTMASDNTEVQTTSYLKQFLSPNHESCCYLFVTLPRTIDTKKFCTE